MLMEVQKMKKMKTIITIQHPQSVHHTNGMVGSWTDWELSELGRRQAKHIGMKLADELSGKDWVMYSSDLARAKETAEIIGNCLGISFTCCKELRERNLGKCVGKSVQWLKENMECQEQTVDDRIFSDAESRRDEWNRLFPFFERVLSDDKENIILVSHGDLLSVFNMMWLGLNVETLNRLELYGLPGGVSHMYQDASGKRYVRKISDMSYLAGSGHGMP